MQHEKKDNETLQPADFPVTEFFLHLSTGAKFFWDEDFERAISEWEEAAKMRPDPESAKRILGNVSYQGNLAEVPLLGFFYVLSSNEQTGVAIVRRDNFHKEVFFKEGWIVCARTNNSEERLGNCLIKRKFVSQSLLDKMAAQAKKKGVKLGTFLVDNGFLLAKELEELLDFQTKEILCDLLSWQEGELYFFEKDVTEADVVVHYTPLDIALFAARRALDFSTFRKVVPHNQVIFHIPPYIEKTKTKIMEELNVNENFIFSLIDGRRNIDQLIKFSGDDQIFTLNILQRLLLMGLIEQSEDVGTYEDTEFEDLSRILKTLLEISKRVMDELRNELGVMAEKVLDRAKENLQDGYDKMFHGISLDGDLSLDANKILKNISVSYPNSSDRLIFIDGAFGIINNLLQEMSHVLGMPLTKDMIVEIDKVKGNIHKFFPESPAKSKVLDVLAQLTVQFAE